MRRFPAERVAIPALLACIVVALSVQQGPDANWDLRNYHLYSPFSLFWKPAGTDLVAAQLQGFLPPTADIVPYLLRNRLNAHPDVLDALLGLPAAIAAVLAYFIGRMVVPAGPGRWLAVLLAAAYGVTGAAGLPTIGTAMSEMPAGLFVLAGLLLLLCALDRPASGRHEGAAGLLLGIGLALKLTVAPFVIAAGVAYVVCCHGGWRGRSLACLHLAGFTLLGALIVGGPWWLHLYRQTGNPIFPYFNNLFRSPLLGPMSMQDDRFWPRSLGQAVLYPLIWGFQKTRIVSESLVRDPRIAFAALSVLSVWAGMLARWWRWGDRPDRAPLCLTLFAAIGFALWERQFAIFRYLAPLEMLSGVLVLLALPRLARGTPAAGAAMLALGLFLACFTRYPDWGRANPAAQAASVTVPPLPRDAMVLLLGDDPLSYVAAFVDPAVRFIGVSNNLVQPGSPGGLSRQVEAAVRGHTGPLWSMQTPWTPVADSSLAFYGLERSGDCTPIQSNLDNSAIRLCPLRRRPQ